MAAANGSTASNRDQVFACDHCLPRKYFALRATLDGSFGAPVSLLVPRELVFDGDLKGPCFAPGRMPLHRDRAGTTDAHLAERLAAGRRSWSQREPWTWLLGAAPRNRKWSKPPRGLENLRAERSKDGFLARMWTLPVMPRRGHRTEAGRA